MKKTILTILVLFPLLGLAQNGTISLQVEGGAGQSITIFSPINTQYFEASKWLDTLDAQGIVLIENDILAPGLFVFKINRRPYYLYVYPEASYEMMIQPDDPANQFKIVHGPNKEGQEALNRIALDDAGLEGEISYAQDDSFASNKERILETIAQKLVPFRSFYASNAIDEDFFQTVELLVENHYAHVLAKSLYTDLRKLVLDPDSLGYDRGIILKHKQHWEDIFKFAPYDRLTSTKVLTYSGLVGYEWFVREWYLTYFVPKFEGHFPAGGRKTIDEYWQEHYAGIKSLYKPGALQEYLLASHIYTITTFKKFEPFIITLFEDFSSIYPESEYTSHLLPEIESVKSFHEKINPAEDDEYQFLPDYATISTFEQLSALFPEEIVYIDLWATWCVPCKEEFQFATDLKKFLRAHDVTALYTSIDRDEADQRWKDMIKFYELAGQHLRASPLLVEDLSRLLSRSQGLTIPRYIILKHGNVIVADALRPSSGDLLHKQIKETL